MVKVRSQQYNKRLTVFATVIAFTLFSVVILITSTLAPFKVNSDYTTAKQLGADWQAFDTNFDRKKVNPAPISISEIYSQLYDVNGNLKSGIITSVTEGGEEKGAKYINSPYNYVATISTATELGMFSYLTNGLQYGQAESYGKADVTIAAFFKAANIRLSNNIDYNGNGSYIIQKDAVDRSKDVTVTLRVNNSEAGTYASNGIYEGYGSISLKNPFAPISGFSGKFDGQNFEVTNLSILRNGKSYYNGSADIDGNGYDAFFASINSGGEVKNFGLTNTRYVLFSGLSNVDNLATADLNTVKYYTAAGICGINNGTIDHSYSTTAKLNGKQESYSSVALNNGVINQVYSGSANFYSDLALSVKTKTLTNSEINAINKTAVIDGGRWYSNANGDRFQNYYYKDNAGYPRLNGLAKQTSSIGEQSFAIYSVADFIAFTHVAQEGFTRIGTVAGEVDTVAAKGSVFVEIKNDLDFSYIGATTLIPIIDFSANTTMITLYSGAGKNGETVTVNNRKTLSNINLSAYMEYGKDTRSYGLFASLHISSACPIRVYAINFIDCAVNVLNDETKDFSAFKTTSAGLICGYTNRHFDIRHIGSNTKVTAKDNDKTGASNRLGGIVGTFANATSSQTTDPSGTKLDYSAKIEGVTVNGEVYNGVRDYNCGNNGANYTRFATGGIIGYNDDANLNNDSNRNLLYTNISVSGTITGFMPKTDIANTNSSITSDTGGVLGYGPIAYGYVGADRYSMLQGASITATINSMPMYDGVKHNFTSKKTNFTINVGGIDGQIGAGAFGYFNGSGDLVKVESVINIYTQLGGDSVGNSVKAFFGTMAGFARQGLFENLETDKFFSGGVNLYQSAATNKKLDLYYGGFVGQATDNTFTNIKNTRAINISGRFSNLEVGGIVGVNSVDQAVKFIDCSNVGNITINPTEGNITVSGICSSKINTKFPDLNFTDCYNSGNISVKSNTGETLGDVSANGIAYTAKSIAGTSLRYSSNTGNITVSVYQQANKNIYVSGIAQKVFFPTSDNQSTFGLYNCINGGTKINGTVTKVSNILKGENLSSASGNVYVYAIGNNVTSANNIENYGAVTAVKSLSSGVIDFGGGVGTADKIINALNEGDVIYNGLSNKVDVNISGIASSAKNISGSINKGNITATGTALSFKIGAIVALMADDGQTLSCVNYGNISFNGIGQADIGGIAGYASTLYCGKISESINFGAIVSAGSTTVINAGGVLGFAGNSVNIIDSFNDGNIKVTCGAAGSAGGIIGLLGNTITAYSKSVITDSFNLANVDYIGTDASAGAGGIVGVVYGIINDSININNCVNSGIISGGANAGGIAGVASGAVSYTFNINSVLNYGKILGSDTANITLGAGGIVGKVSSGGIIVINGAVNYGTVGNANCYYGGILGVNSGKATLNYVASYATASDNGNGIIGHNSVSSSALKINLAIFVDPISGGTKGAATNYSGLNVYTANNSSADSITLSQLYDNSFVIAPGANENSFYAGGASKTCDTTFSTLVWSEKPYSNGGEYHSPTVESTGKVFAVTTNLGRRTGKYVGDNYNRGAINALLASDTVRLNSVLSRLGATKQITQSRDTFVDFFEFKDGADTESLQKLTFFDKAKSGGTEFQDLPQAAYLKDKNQFSTTILSDSPYYDNNFNSSDFWLRVSDIVLRAPVVSGNNATLSDIFSQNASATTLKIVESKDINFNNLGGEAVSQIVTYKATVSQGAPKQGATEQELAEYNLLYTQTYIFKIQYFNSAKTMVMKDENNSFIFNYKTVPNDIVSPNVNLKIDSSTENSVSHKFVKAGTDTEIPVNWVYSQFTAVFTTNGISEENLNKAGNVTTELYIKDSGLYVKYIDTVLDVYDLSKYIKIELRTFAFSNLEVDVGGQIITVPIGKFEVKVTLTDRDLLREIDAGDYKFELKFDNFVKTFEFTKEQSGDVFLHNNIFYANNDNLATSLTAIFSSINKPEESLPEYTGITNFHNYKYSEQGGKKTYEIGFATDYTLSADYYGALSYFNGIGKNVFGFFNGQVTQSRFALARPSAFNPPYIGDVPRIIIIRNSAGQLAKIEYKFSITAQNGDIGNFNYVFNYTLPVPKIKLTNNDGINLATGTVAIPVGKTASLDINAAYTIDNKAGSDVFTVSKTEVMYQFDSKDSTKTIGYFADGIFTAYEGAADTVKDMRMPIYSSNGLNTKVTFERNTSGGIFSFVPYFKYKSTFSNIKDTSQYISFVTILDSTVDSSETVEIETLEMAEFNVLINNVRYKVEKLTSKNAYLKDMSFSSSIPDKGKLMGYDPAQTNALITITDGISKNNNSFSTDYGSGILVNPDTEGNKYFLDTRWKSFRLSYNFPDSESGEDYTSILTLKIDGDIHAGIDEFTYNDESTQVYVMTYKNGVWEESGTPLAKTDHMTTADGKTVIDYQSVDIFLPESTVIKVRVRAGDPRYYNDYEFLSEGPLRNKIFNIQVSSGDDSAGNVFIPTLRRTITNIDSGKTKIMGISSLLYRTVKGGAAYPDYDPNSDPTFNKFYDALYTRANSGGEPASGEYAKPYISTLNTSGKYSLALQCNVRGYNAIITSIQVSAENVGRVINITKDSFEILGEEPLTVEIKIRILNNQSPPWGDQIFS